MDLILFNIGFAAQVLAILYGGSKGGGPERIVAAGTLLAWLASAAVTTREFYFYPESAVFVIDCLFLAFAMAIVVAADRQWPIWFAGWQALSVIAHIARMADPGILPSAYHEVSAYSIYPMLAVLVAGTVRHQQRSRRYGIDPSWRRFSHRSTRNPPSIGRG